MMKRFIRLFLLIGLALSFVGNYAYADFLWQSGETLPQGTATMEECMSVATKLIPGHVVVLEFKTHKGIPMYEFEIRAKDGIRWNVEVNAQTGIVMEFEKHVQPNDPVFKSKAKISKKKAENLAISVMPGTIDRCEYLIEDDGEVLYEFDIHAIYGSEFEVRIDAATGKIHKVCEEHWEIGEFKD